MENRLRTTLPCVCAYSLLWTSLATTCGAQAAGVVAGEVTDERGVALGGAKVNAQSLDGRPEGSGVRYVETDADGRFAIDRLPLGRYSVFAMKEDAGYPDMEPSFYSDGTKIPVATITAATPVATVSIRLGPKAAIVEGSVSDASTGAPVNGFFSLMRIANPQGWLSTSLPATYRVLVPALTDVSLSVTAPGYEKWTDAGPINLRSGQEMHLDVSLEPARDPNLQPSQFLIPDGYSGWVLLVYNQKDAPPVQIDDGIKVFKFSKVGRLTTSSAGPDRGADNKYLYYSADGSVRDVPMDYKNGKGMIWGEYEGTQQGVMSEYGFFVGTEQQYSEARNHRPIR
jgi:Carboxypeptidase regulatory-like domain